MILLFFHIHSFNTIHTFNILILNVEVWGRTYPSNVNPEKSNKNNFQCTL